MDSQVRNSDDEGGDASSSSRAIPCTSFFSEVQSAKLTSLLFELYSSWTTGFQSE